jgi:peptidoglycan hydrolase FlgJ
MNISDKSMMMYNNANLDRMKAVSERTLNKEDKELRAACNDFETLFVKQMLDSMRKTVQKAEKSDGNGGKDYFEDMLYDNYAKSMSETANLGIAKMMYKQLYKSV